MIKKLLSGIVYVAIFLFVIFIINEKGPEHGEDPSVYRVSKGYSSDNKNELRREQQKSRVSIEGYNDEIKAPTRTLVVFDGIPLLLNRPMKNSDADEGLDAVRMTDGRLFLCIHQRNDNCWRVINGGKNLLPNRGYTST